MWVDSSPVSTPCVSLIDLPAAGTLPRLASMDPQLIHVWMNVHLTWPNLLHLCFWAKNGSGVISFFMITYVNPELVNCLLISIENFDIWWLIGFYFCTIGLLKWSQHRHACLRLVLNEVLRCKPGSLIIMAPDCRSLSKMYLVFLDMVSYNMFDQLWKNHK